MYLSVTDAPEVPTCSVNGSLRLRPSRSRRPRLTIAVLAAKIRPRAGRRRLPQARSATGYTEGPATVVRMDACSFEPTVIHVPVGTTVRFLNTAQNEHAVSGRRQRGRSADILGPGDEFSERFDEAGIYPYTPARSIRAWSGRSSSGTAGRGGRARDRGSGRPGTRSADRPPTWPRAEPTARGWSPPPRPGRPRSRSAALLGAAVRRWARRSAAAASGPAHRSSPDGLSGPAGSPRPPRTAAAQSRPTGRSQGARGALGHETSTCQSRRSGRSGRSGAPLGHGT